MSLRHPVSRPLYIDVSSIYTLDAGSIYMSSIYENIVHTQICRLHVYEYIDI